MSRLEIMSPQRFRIPGGIEQGGDYKRTINLASYQKAGAHFNVEFLTKDDFNRFCNFFDEVKKRNNIAFGMFYFCFVEDGIWAKSTMVECDSDIKVRFIDHGNGEKVLGNYEDI